MLFTAIPAYRWESIQKKARSLAKYGCTVKLVEVCQHEKGQVITIDITIPDHLETGRWQFLGIKKDVGTLVIFLVSLEMNLCIASIAIPAVIENL